MPRMFAATAHDDPPARLDVSEEVIVKSFLSPTHDRNDRPGTAGAPCIAARWLILGNERNA